jgi:hypothetical protein
LVERGGERRAATFLLDAGIGERGKRLPQVVATASAARAWRGALRGRRSTRFMGVLRARRGMPI